MTIPADIFTALRGLVADRVYPDTFPQDVRWPAIRYSFFSVVPDHTVCGSGGDVESDFRVQVDVVSKTDTERDTLRASIQTAFDAFTIPTVCEDWSKEYDTDTKAYRARMDFLIEPSSA